LIQFNFNNTVFAIQFIPVYGLAAGLLYYNPNLEPDQDNVDEEEFYQQLIFMFFIFGIHITWFDV